MAALEFDRRQSLDAQAALLAHALVLFGVGLPIYVWAASFAPDRPGCLASFAIFAINWAAFYAVQDWARRRPQQLANVGLRTRVHVLGGLLWSVAVAQIGRLRRPAPARRASRCCCWPSARR